MTVVDVKSILIAYRDTERYIDVQIERLELLEAKIESVGSPTLSDMPKPPSPSVDRIAEMAQRKVDLEAKIKRLMQEQAFVRSRIEKATEELPDKMQRTVIQTRYLDREKWDTINFMIFGGEADYADKADSYMRRIMILHGQALEKLAEIYEADRSL
ncbi:MAG: hypothetical protein IJM76_05730 [Lachnospiraceae bacterium]|nr:hypothetical protein [Lachnospiraceae bacterium]